MVGSGEDQRETIRPEFNPSITIDFQGAKITSDTGFLLLIVILKNFHGMKSHCWTSHQWHPQVNP